MSKLTINLPERQLQAVRSILQRYAPKCEVYAFGSRVTGTARPYSDLDLAVHRPVAPENSTELIWTLREAFSESDIPITVDVVDYHNVSPEFQRIMQENWIRINPPFPS